MAQKESRKKQLASYAGAALVQVMNLASAAQIPVAGPFISVAKELIGMIESMRSNSQQAKDLLRMIETYAGLLRDFIEAISEEYIQASESVQANLAKRGIKRFEEEMSVVSEIIKKRKKAYWFLRFIGVSLVTQELQDCAARLRRARDEFMAYQMNIHTADNRVLRLSTVGVNKTLPLTPIEQEMKDIHIIGARLMTHSELRVLDILHANRTLLGERPSFWADIQSVKVDDGLKLVKLYYKKCGGEKVFLKDLKFLSQNIGPYFPLIQGFCGKASIPFILLLISTLTPFKNYLTRLHTSNSETALSNAWKLVLDMRDAAKFLLENNSDIDHFTVQSCIMDAAVDDCERLVLPPPVDIARPENLPTDSIEQMIFWAWFKVIQGRRFRALAYSLLSARRETFERHRLPQDSPSLAQEILREYSLFDPSRTLPVRSRQSRNLKDKELLLPGTVGVLSRSESATSVQFTPFEELRSVLGGYEPLFEEDLEKIADGAVVRKTFLPSAGSDSDAPSLPFIGFMWKPRSLKRPADMTELMTRARELAKARGVDLTELVILAGTCWHIPLPITNENIASSFRKTFKLVIDTAEGALQIAWSFDDAELDITLPQPRLEPHQ
ncbi:hypothetical protein FRB90_000103 [Tulasnella sp. 427]|nr:hypothetical protein FRB90_000103 [Tulasnella sp. 427]